MVLIVESEFVPGFEDEAFGAVLAELADFAVFEDAEGFVDAALSADVFRVENVAEFVDGQSIEVGEDGIKFGLPYGTVFLVPYYRLCREVDA